MQPDSLKLASQLAILKLLHKTAFKLDESLGDKSSGKTFYLRGIQGQVRKYILNSQFGSIIIILLSMCPRASLTYIEVGRNVTM